MDRYYIDFKINPGPLSGVHKDPPDPLIELLKQKGIAHEAEILKRFQTGLVKIDADSNDEKISKTQNAIQAGNDFIYQAALIDEHFFGFADILRKVSLPSSLGNYSYEPIDIKIASHPKPGAILQLCAYCFILKKIQGIYPEQFSIITVDGEEHFFRTADYMDYFIAFKDYFLDFHSRFDPKNMPVPNKTASHWDWNIFARKQLHISDDVSMTANIRMSHVASLKSAGISTLTGLANLQNEKVKNVPSKVLNRLKEQAGVQVLSKGKDIPEFKVLLHGDKRCGLAMLPNANAWDVFFDMEGYPLLDDNGLEYLYGNFTIEGGYKAFWAHSKLEEAKAFNEWMNWAHERWTQHPEMHIYHYGSYEPSTLKRLMGNYGVCERIIDDFLRNTVFVNLQNVVTQGLRIGTFSYSLKEIERLYYPERQTKVHSGADSAVMFAAWLDTNDKQYLQEIQDYNLDDCKSTYELCRFLWKIRDLNQIKYVPFKAPIKAYDEEEKEGIKFDCSRKAISMLKDIPLEQRGLPLKDNKPEYYIGELLAYILDYYRREDNPGWWEYFSKREMDEDELMEDPYTLACVRVVSKSMIDEHEVFECEFDIHQDCKFIEGSDVIVLEHQTTHENYKIQKIDFINGKVVLKKVKANLELEGDFTLIPAMDHIIKDNLQKSLLKVANNFNAPLPLCGLPKPVFELLTRAYPDIAGFKHSDNLLKSDDNIKEQAAALCKKLNNSILCVQVPPGTGKSTTAAHMILALVKDGKKVAISSNSHKVISSLIECIDNLANQDRKIYRPLKVSSENYKKSDEALFANRNIPVIEDAKDIHLIEGVSKRKNKVITALGGVPNVVGATAYSFSKYVFNNHFDYLFVDEATQVCIANLLSMAQCATNILMFGDQMQLQQPTRGSHPGNSSLSALVLYTEHLKTVEPTKGIFLPLSFRLHSGICQFISDAFYEGKLKSDAITDKRRINTNSNDLPNAGIKFISVNHVGNRHCSDEEVEIISNLYASLLSSTWIDEHGTENQLTSKDILIVAPYNVQVEKIKRSLGPDACVGSVDLFQGKEAPVVILSMCASTVKDAPRGPSFLLDKNRMNVAISRAKCLAVVVGSTEIMDYHCGSIKIMGLMNTYAKIMNFLLYPFIPN